MYAFRRCFAHHFIDEFYIFVYAYILCNGWCPYAKCVEVLMFICSIRLKEYIHAYRQIWIDSSVSSLLINFHVTINKYVIPVCIIAVSSHFTSFNFKYSYRHIAKNAVIVGIFVLMPHLWSVNVFKWYDYNIQYEYIKLVFRSIFSPINLILLWQ